MVIIINGSRNAGKTTVAKLLAKKLPKTAHIEVDALRWFVPGLNLERSIPLNLENAVSVTKNFVKNKFNVVINYCLRKKDYNYLLYSLKTLDTKIYTFTLKPSLETVLSNRGKELSKDDLKRIKQQYRKGPNYIIEAGLVIDSTNKSANQVIKVILNNI